MKNYLTVFVRGIIVYLVFYKLTSVVEIFFFSLSMDDFVQLGFMQLFSLFVYVVFAVVLWNRIELFLPSKDTNLEATTISSVQFTRIVIIAISFFWLVSAASTVLATLFEYFLKYKENNLSYMSYQDHFYVTSGVFKVIISVFCIVKSKMIAKLLLRE